MRATWEKSTVGGGKGSCVVGFEGLARNGRAPPASRFEVARGGAWRGPERTKGEGMGNRKTDRGRVHRRNSQSSEEESSPPKRKKGGKRVEKARWASREMVRLRMRRRATRGFEARVRKPIFSLTGAVHRWSCRMRCRSLCRALGDERRHGCIVSSRPE